MKARAKKKPTGDQYQAPISHERFAHMAAALLGHVRGLRRERSIRTPGFATYRIERAARGETLDEATALEIADALHKLRGIYRDEALRATRPNRREDASDLRDAVNAQALVEHFGLNLERAMVAITGKTRRVERDSLARTQKHRAQKARLLGIEPDWKAIEAAAKKARKAEE
ncbi:MAG: hypothetical protein AB7P31_15230 [Steroidobacteraceae bacterium]